MAAKTESEQIIIHAGAFSCGSRRRCRALFCLEFRVHAALGLPEGGTPNFTHYPGRAKLD